MTRPWRPADDAPGLIGDEAIVAFDMLTRPSHPAQRGLALGYLLTRTVHAPKYTAGGYSRDVGDELAPALALALSPENPAGPDVRHASPEVLREHDLAIVEATLLVAKAGEVPYCRPLVDYLRTLAVRPAANWNDRATWGAREFLSVRISMHIGERWLDTATPGCLDEVAEALRSGSHHKDWLSKAILDTGAHLSTDAAAVLRAAWDVMPKEPSWPAALVGAGLIHHLDDLDRWRAVDLAVHAAAWAPVALDVIARAEGIGPAADTALDALLDVAEGQPTGRVARNAMLRAVLIIDDRLVRRGRASVAATLPRAVEIAKRCYPAFERVHAALRRLS